MTQSMTQRMNQRAPETLTDLPSRSTSAGILVILTSVATLIGLLAHGERDVWSDEAVLNAVQAIDAPGLATAIRISNFAFDTTGAMLVAVGLILAALLLRRPVFVLEVAIAISLRAVVIVLKPLFGSPRPGPVHHLDSSLVPDTFGYPSGHAFTATVVTSLFVLFVHSLDVPQPVKRTAIVVAVAITAVGMFARIWIGAHWPSDTIGGVLYGVAAIALMRIVVTFIVLRFRRRSSTR